MQGYLKRFRVMMVFSLLTVSILLLAAQAVYAACGTPPDISIDPTEKDVLPGGSVDYTVTITNKAAGSCTFDLSTSGDSANFSSAVSVATLTISANGASDTFTVTVSDDTGQAISTNNSTTITVDTVDTIVTTTVNNPLLHNSHNLGSTKWSGDNGWGLATGKYGEFSCSTCHGKNTGNIKRVKNLIPATIGAAVAKPVNFQAITGSNSFGDDDPLNNGTGHDSSNKICEVCHSITNHHNYDSTKNNTPGLSHYNEADCTQCHKHNEGFKASGCNGCHGDTSAGNFWPDTESEDSADYPDRLGLHVEHVNAIGDAINGGVAGSASMNDKNASCVYCHPNPGGANVDGTSHDTDTDTSPLSTPDLHKDGWNPVTDYTDLQGTLDTDGYYTPAIRRCSLVECHSNGEFTWTWYSDVVAPGRITNLAAGTGSEVGSIDLTWTAPANDDNDGPNSYYYEVRYAPLGAILDEADWTAATVAGGPPSVGRRGKANDAKMTVTGLVPGDTYYFAVKAFDEANNAPLPSNSPSAPALADTQSPIFFGLGSAVAVDETGTVVLNWDIAQDHSLPVTYTVYYDSGPIDFNGTQDTAITTTGTNLKVEGLSLGVVYNFAVRATDAAGNQDTNTLVLQALPKKSAIMPLVNASYYTNGANVLQSSDYGTTSSTSFSSGSTRIWTVASGSGYTEKKNVYGSIFAIRVRDRNEASGQQLTAELGYDTGSGFTSFSSPITAVRDITSFSDRIQNFNFANQRGVVPGGGRLAVKLTNTGSQTMTIYSGSSTNRGDVTVVEQTYNHLPNSFAFSPQPSGAGIVTISWTNTGDPDGDTVHYDVVGSDDGGATYKYIIAQDLTTTSVDWNTVTAGIGLELADPDVRVKVLAMDGFQSGDGSGANATEVESNIWTVDNTSDAIPPGKITDLTAETRPRSGSVYLTWTAPGDDGYETTRADQYDIRYSTAPLTELNWDELSTVQVDGEPVPDFGGQQQGYEVLGLSPGTTYYFAIKAADEEPLWSEISNSPSANGGERCGICHSTPPDDTATSGNHIDHGYTVNDCAKCHGDAVLAYSNTDYGVVGSSHQDGKLQLGFGRDSAGVKLDLTDSAVSYVVVAGDDITYYQDPDGAGPGSAYKIYEDLTGSGGYTDTGGDQIDNGSCFNFDNVNATGCHGPASPSWDEAASLACADCHGTPGRSTDPYGRAFDDTSERVEASPPVDNHGNLGNETELAKRKYVGQHEKHLNYSFRYAKGDSCSLCHKDNNHADGTVDFNYDLTAAGASATYNENAKGSGLPSPGSCGSTSGITCHGTTVTPYWDNNDSVGCVNCHQFNGTPPDHITDPNGIGFSDDNKGNCEWCHVAGHPKGDVTGTVLVPNNVVIGINYSGGGIHLRNNIGGRTAVTSEAEICWGCHDDNNISEWGTNTQAATGSSTYNYGTLKDAGNNPTSDWVSATWVSGTSAFSYKEGAIQSTHSTNVAGTSAVSLNDAVTPVRYEETVDNVADLRCSNCHDVHNRNLADSDTMTGAPYLRGTWMGNPYKEDGAPQDGTVYSSLQYPVSVSGEGPENVGFGRVPRGGLNNETGGFQIDQNNSYPTQGWTLQSSAGLCVLCHGDDVNELDQKTGENLWLGSNGHSNSALGGIGNYATNIFDYTHGRPVPFVPNADNEESRRYRTANMANQHAGIGALAETYFPIGYRNGFQSPTIQPPTLMLRGNESVDFDAYKWGAAVDADSIDYNYHQFSCSKCHNPHASRLPKLMITNCLDVRQNTWDENPDNDGNTTEHLQRKNVDSVTDYDKTPAYFVTAQNCHRRDGARTADTPKVTGTNISFAEGALPTDNDTISGSGFETRFNVGEYIRVTGSNNNDGHYKIITVTATDIEVAPGALTAESAGANVKVEQPDLMGGWNRVTPW